MDKYLLSTINHLRRLINKCPKWVVITYIVIVWINVGLLFGSYQARNWSRYFSFCNGDFNAKEFVFPFPSQQSYYNFNKQITSRINAWDIRTYDWTEFLAYLIIPFLCIVTCILVLERTDKIKDASPDDSTQKENEEISLL